MKRNLSLDSTTVVVATLSQASVPGAEEACTAIAIVACAAHLTASSKSTMELWIHQGGALHSVIHQGGAKGAFDFSLCHETKLEQ